MSKEDIMSLAIQLGNAIAKSEELEKIRDIQVELQNDSVAYDLMIRYQEARTQIEHKLEEGLILTATEENHLDILEQSIKNNPILQKFIQAQEGFDKLMQGVYYAMNQALSHGDSCSCGCDSSCDDGCHGCC